jgi:acetate kinase
MPILVINGGSSSLKFSMFERRSAGPHQLLEGEVAGVGSADATLEVRARGGSGLGLRRTAVKAPTPSIALRLALDAVSADHMPPAEAVGYRVVHPGPKLHAHQRITRAVLRDLEAAKAFAPLHDPEAVTLIEQGMKRFLGIPHFACFDTVFHQTMPPQATTYPIPKPLRDHGVRRYGFHGLSCESVVDQLRSAGRMPHRMAIAHLGSGCSITALIDGRSVDTTMGLTPTGGVVMGTRPGDLDPGLVLYLLRHQQGATKQALTAVEAMLNHRAGLVALSGMPNDVQAMRKAAADGNADATLALEIFTRSITKTLGGFCFLLGGLDAIVFTGGIGEHDAATRSEVLANLAPLGIALDPVRNQTPDPASASPVRNITAKFHDTGEAGPSATSVWVVPAQEDRMIAIHVDLLLKSNQ